MNKQNEESARIRPAPLSSDGVRLLIGNQYGVYVPQLFAHEFDLELFDGISAEDAEVLKQEPDADGYWDAWDAVLNNASLTDSNGNQWFLHQDGDLFALCPDLMSDEQTKNFDMYA